MVWGGMNNQPLSSTVLALPETPDQTVWSRTIVATQDYLDRPATIDAHDRLLWLPTWPTVDRRGRLVFTTADTSEDWIRTLLTTLSDQLKLQAMPELQMAMVREVG